MTKVKLTDFDNCFLQTIKDYKKIHLNPADGVFYTIVFDGKKAGVIGFKQKENGKHFLKIGIHQNFRGKGVFQKALLLLVKRHKIKKVYSTVALANTASIKAHRKLGFRKIPKSYEEKLKKSGLLLKRNIRLVRTFN